jgi:hypothetical protein
LFCASAIIGAAAAPRLAVVARPIKARRVHPDNPVWRKGESLILQKVLASKSFLYVAAYRKGLVPWLFQKYARMITLATAA